MKHNISSNDWLHEVSPEIKAYKVGLISSLNHRSINDEYFDAKYIKENSVLVEDPDVLLEWINQNSGHYKWVQKNKTFINHLKNAPFAQRYIENLIVHENGYKALEFHPEFLSQRWFAKAAISNYFPEDFIKKHCHHWLHDKDFFEEMHLQTRQINLFEHFATRENILKRIETNPYQVKTINKELLNDKQFVLQLTTLKSDQAIICKAYGLLSPTLQLDPDILKAMFKEKSNWELRHLNKEAYSAEAFKEIITHIRGVETLGAIGDMALEILSQDKMDLKLLFDTLKIISKKAIPQNSSYIELMGGAVYNKHVINQFLNSLKTKFPIMNDFFYSQKGKYYFEPIKHTDDYEKYETKLSQLWNNFKPFYNKYKLESKLALKPEEGRKYKI